MVWGDTELPGTFSLKKPQSLQSAVKQGLSVYEDNVASQKEGVEKQRGILKAFLDDLQMVYK